MIYRLGVGLLFISSIDRAPFRGGRTEEKIMQKPNTLFARKPTAPVATAGKTDHGSGQKPATTPAGRNEADKNAKPAQKK